MQKIRDLRKQNIFEKSYLEATCTHFEIHSSSREKKVILVFVELKIQSNE